MRRLRIYNVTDEKEMIIGSRNEILEEYQKMLDSGDYTEKLPDSIPPNNRRYAYSIVVHTDNSIRYMGPKQIAGYLKDGKIVKKDDM